MKYIFGAVFCIMKWMVLTLLLITTQLYAFVPAAHRLLSVADSNNEQLAGVKIEVLGTDEVYYTNSKGECLIPFQVLNNARGIRIEYISYKTAVLKKDDLNSKIVLETR